MQRSKIFGAKTNDVSRYSLKQYLGVLVLFYGSLLFVTYPLYTSVSLTLIALALLKVKFNGGIQLPSLSASKVE